MVIKDLSILKIHKLTQAQYDRELSAGRIDANALYLTPDEELDLSMYATMEQLATKANSDHNHDDDYYTESEVDSLLVGKANVVHNHDSDYDEKGSASAAVNTHDTSTSAHNDIRVLISDLTTKLNNFLDVDDTTTDQLSEVITLINNNKGTLESLTSSKVNVSDIVNNLTTNSSSKVLSAAQGVVIKGLIDALDAELDSHTHDMADVSGLDSALDAKVPISRTINGKALTANITLSASDVSAYTKTEIDNMELITADDIDTICGGAIQVATLSNEVTF